MAKATQTADPIPDGRVRVRITMNGYACPGFPHRRYEAEADIPPDAAEQLIELWADFRKKMRGTDGPRG